MAIKHVGTRDAQGIWDYTQPSPGNFPSVNDQIYVDTSGVASELIVQFSWRFDNAAGGTLTEFIAYVAAEDRGGWDLGAGSSMGSPIAMAPSAVVGDATISGSLVLLSEVANGGCVLIYKNLPKWAGFRFDNTSFPTPGSGADFLRGAISWR